jgi:hypothetical protein
MEILCTGAGHTPGVGRYTSETNPDEPPPHTERLVLFHPVVSVRGETPVGGRSHESLEQPCRPARSLWAQSPPV